MTLDEAGRRFVAATPGPSGIRGFYFSHLTPRSAL